MNKTVYMSSKLSAVTHECFPMVTIGTATTSARNHDSSSMTIGIILNF